MTTATVVESETPTTETPDASGVSADESAAFHATFQQEAGLSTDTPSAPTPEQKVPVETSETDDTKGEDGKAETTQAAAEPEYVQILKADWERVQSTLEDLGGRLKKGMDDYGGRIGGLQQAVQQLRESGPRGGKVQITDEDFAELRTDFPELADMTRKGIERIIGKIVAGGESAPPVDKTALKTEISHELKREALAEDHEDWEQIVGLPDQNGTIPDTPFRRWVAQKPEAEQQKIYSVWNPRYLSQVISDFKESQKKPKTAAELVNTRQARLKSAVTPKGAGGGSAGPAVQTEAQAFAEAFRNERKG